MADTEKEKDGKVDSVEKLKFLVGDIIDRKMKEDEFVKVGDLKELVREEMKPVVSDELKDVFEEHLKTIEKLPGQNGEKDIKAGDNELKGLSKTGNYDYFAEYAKDVYLATMAKDGGVEPSPRFGAWQGSVKAYNKVVKAGDPSLEIGDPEQGGYLVPEEFSATLLERGFTNSNFISRCTKVPMQTNQVGMPFQEDFTHTSYLHGAMMAYWKDELALKTATKPKFGKVTLKLQKLILLVYSSDELLEDSVVSMEPLLRKKAGDVFGWKIDESVIRGSGAGQPLGILGAPALVTQDKEAGQKADTIVYENIVKMWSRMHPRNLANAVWVANSNTFPQIATMSLVVGTGGAPVYLPATGAAGAPFGTLFGKPIIFSEHCTTLGSLGDIFLIDFSEYLVGQKRGAGKGVQYAKSIHIQFLYDQTAFRFVMRMDGQPWWPAVFTPIRGDTQSPYVTLQARD